MKRFISMASIRLIHGEVNMSDRSTLVWKIQHDLAYEALNQHVFLYKDWVHPNDENTWRDCDVLDAGSGPGIQVRLLSSTAKSVTAVDLEAIDVSKWKNQGNDKNIKYIKDDIMLMDLGRQFDVVNCVGTIHHTDDPTRTFKNLHKHLKPGGRMIIWAYAREGNGLMRAVVEPLRKLLLDKASHPVIYGLSYFLTTLMWPFVNTLYRLPLRFLPYYEYFGNFRKMSFHRNVLNVYDKLNAPQQYFLPKETIESWFNDSDYENVHISPYMGVSWRASGNKKIANSI